MHKKNCLIRAQHLKPITTEIILTEIFSRSMENLGHQLVAPMEKECSVLSLLGHTEHISVLVSMRTPSNNSQCLMHINSSMAVTLQHSLKCTPLFKTDLYQGNGHYGNCVHNGFPASQNKGWTNRESPLQPNNIHFGPVRTIGIFKKVEGLLNVKTFLD